MAQVTFIDFWAPWCGPCKAMNPIIDEIEKEMGEKLEIKKINVDEDPSQEAPKMGIMSIPTYVILKEGKEVGRKVGMTSKSDLLNLINS